MPKRKPDETRPEPSESKKLKKAKPKTAAKSSSYTAAQKTAIAEFGGVTHADKSTAAKWLKQSNWNVSAAVNAYFSSPANAASNPLRSSLAKIFDKYREDPRTTPDEINVEGTGTLLEELQIDLSDVGALVFSELVQSPSLGVITREGFINGWSEVGADSLPKMRTIVQERRAALETDRDLFKDVYNHTFVLALQDKQKALPMEMATEFWRVLFSPPALEWRTANTPWLEWWFEFYEAKVKKAVNKDLWKQTLTFAQETIKDDSLGFWSEESSWPSVIDEFVGWVKTTKRPGGAPGEPMEVE